MNMDSERTRELAANLADIDRELASDNNSQAEAIVAAMHPDLVVPAIGISLRFALIHHNEGVTEPMLRALQIWDRLIMLRQGLNYPNENLFFLFRARQADVMDHWRRMSELKEIYGVRTWDLKAKLDGMRFYDLDASAKVASAYHSLLIQKQEDENGDDTELITQNQFILRLIRELIERQEK